MAEISVFDVFATALYGRKISDDSVVSVNSRS